MKTLRITCAAIALNLAITLSAVAGQISSPGYVPPPPPGETNAPPTTSITTTVVLTILSLIR